MNIIRANLKSIIILLLVILGVAVTVYLVKNPQILKSRADVEGLNVTDKNGNSVTKVEGKFTTTSDHIKIGVQDINKF